MQKNVQLSVHAKCVQSASASTQSCVLASWLRASHNLFVYERGTFWYGQWSCF